MTNSPMEIQEELASPITYQERVDKNSSNFAKKWLHTFSLLEPSACSFTKGSQHELGHRLLCLFLRPDVTLCGLCFALYT